jgi:hypothetical protein
MAHAIPGLTVHYGTVLDVLFATGDMRISVTEWRGWHMLVSERAMTTAPGRVKLYLVKGTIKERTRLTGDELDRAQEQYERWHRRDAKELGQIVSIPEAIAWRQGRVLRIGYRSDKWSPRGKMNDYDHDFTEGGARPPWLYTSSQAIEKARAAVIVGGTMAITEGGID